MKERVSVVVVKDSGWATDAEKAYLDNIGEFASKTANLPDKKVMLERYILGAVNRSDWGKIDNLQVIHHARQLLTNLSMAI